MIYCLQPQENFGFRVVYTKTERDGRFGTWNDLCVWALGCLGGIVVGSYDVAVRYAASVKLHVAV